MLEAIFLLVLSFAIQSMFTPAAQNNYRPPEAFEEIEFPQAKEGTAQCVFFGECWTADWTVLGVGSYRTTPIVTGGGGKK